MKSKIVGLLAVALLAGPMAAQAVTIVLDNPHQTVVRPTSGSIQVNFFGTVTNEEQQVIGNCGIQEPYIGLSDDRLSVGSAESCKDLGFALRFFVLVESTSRLGLYANRYGSGDYPVFRIAVPIDGGPAAVFYTAAYSLNVVERLPVPEPGTLALLGLGLLGLGVTRRKAA